MAWTEIEDSQRSPREQRGITFKSKSFYINAGLQKEIGDRRFRVLVNDSDFQLAIKFEDEGIRTRKTPDIPIVKTYDNHPWLKECIGKFKEPYSITKEMILFKIRDGIIDFPIEKKVLKPLFDNEKEYTIKELSEIIECSTSHSKRRIKEVGIIPKYKIRENNIAIGIIRGCDINAALELKPDLFKKIK
jgi:hypothetical protein